MSLCRFGVVVAGLLAVVLSAPAQNPAAIKPFNQGVEAFDKKDYDTAIKAFTEALKIDPKFGQAYYNRALAAQNKGDYDPAIADYTQAIKFDPKYALAYNNRGMAYQAKK